MRKLPTGSGVIRGLRDLLTSTKGAVLSIVGVCIIIAGAGIGFWHFHGAAPASSLAMFVPTATALPTPTPTLIPTSTSVPRAAPTSVYALKLTLDSYFIRETGCRGIFSPIGGITVTNSGGGTLIWHVSASQQMLFSTGKGSLPAGQSHQETMSWYQDSAGPLPPLGTVYVTFTSNGGDAQAEVECAPS